MPWEFTRSKGADVMYQTTKRLSLIGALTLSAAFVSPSFAENAGTSKTFPDTKRSETLSEYKPSLGINVGLASPESTRKSAAGYGIEFGFQPIIPFSSAIELSGFTSQHQNDQATLTRTKLLYKAGYNFGGTIPVIKDSYAALGFGPIFDNIRNRMDVELGVSPIVGFDIPITDSAYSLGANASYMFVGGPNNDAFALNGVAKYWF
jgi:hypothetical protein